MRNFFSNRETRSETARVSRSVKTVCVDCGCDIALQEIDSFFEQIESRKSYLKREIQQLLGQNTQYASKIKQIDDQNFLEKLVFTDSKEKPKYILQIGENKNRIAALERELKGLVATQNEEIDRVDREMFRLRFSFSYYMRNANTLTKQDRRLYNAREAIKIINDNQSLLTTPAKKAEATQMLQDAVGLFSEIKVGDIVQEARLQKSLENFKKAKELFRIAIATLETDEIRDDLQENFFSSLRIEIAEIDSVLSQPPGKSPGSGSVDTKPSSSGPFNEKGFKILAEVENEIAEFQEPMSATTKNRNGKKAQVAPKNAKKVRQSNEFEEKGNNIPEAPEDWFIKIRVEGKDYVVKVTGKSRKGLKGVLVDGTQVSSITEEDIIDPNFQFPQDDSEEVPESPLETKYSKDEFLRIIDLIFCTSCVAGHLSNNKENKIRVFIRTFSPPDMGMKIRDRFDRNRGNPPDLEKTCGYLARKLGEEDREELFSFCSDILFSSGGFPEDSKNFLENLSALLAVGL